MSVPNEPPEVVSGTARKKSLLGQTSSVALGRIVSAVITALSMIVLARAVQPIDFAQYSVALVASAFICVTLDQGLETLVTRASALGDVDEMSRANGTHSLLMAGAFLFAPVVALVSVSPIWLAVLVQAAAIGERRMSFWVGRLVGANRSHVTVPLLVLGRTPPLALGVWMVAFPATNPFLLYSLLVVGGCFMSSVVGAHIARRDGVWGSQVDFRVLRRSRPFWIASTIGQVRQLDLVAIRYISSGIGLPAYAPASRLVGPMKLLPSSLGAAVFPRAVSGAHADVRQAVRATWLAVPPTLLLTAVVWIFGEPVLNSILGPEYSGSWTPMAILATSVCVGIPGAVASSALQGYGFQRFVARVEILLLAVQALSLLALVPILGANGAALSVVVTSVVLTYAKSRRLHLFLEGKL